MFSINNDIASKCVFSEFLLLFFHPPPASLEAAEVSENLKSSTASEKELMGLCVSFKVAVNFDANL